MIFLIDNWYLVLAALVSGGMLAWPMLTGRTAAGQLTPAETVTLINRERAVLIDVSDASDYGAGHAVGAKNIPFATIETSTALPRNKTLPLVVVCANGARAGKAATLLQARGYARAQALAGGLAAWRAANLPVEKSVA